MKPPPLLPEELVLEILYLLPVKSLLRFKCVSKSWNSTISDSQFIKLHLHRSYSTRNADFAAYFRSPENRLAIAAATPICVPDEYQFSGTFDGLICLSEHEENYFRIRLWNPATKSMSQHSPPLYVKNGSLGFGYDCSTETYKVVAVVRSYEEIIVNVYNNGDTCWRSIQVYPLLHTYPCGMCNGAVYVNNTLNWLAILPDVFHGHSFIEQMNSDPFIIFSFDLGKENCAKLSLPYCPRSRYKISYFKPNLGVLKGCLCFCHSNKKLQFVIWQMKEFGVHNSWTRLFKITIGYQSIIDNIFRWPCFAMDLSENGDFLLSKRGVSQSRAVLYTHKDNKLEEVTNIANDIVDCYANNYIESLVSPY